MAAPQKPSSKPLAEKPAASVPSTPPEASPAPGADVAAAAADEPVVRVYNRNANTFTHGEYVLGPNGTAVVPVSVAELWESHKYADGPAVVREAPAIADKATENKLAKKDAQIRELEAQVAGLTAILEKARAANPGKSDDELIALLSAGK